MELIEPTLMELLWCLKDPIMIAVIFSKTKIETEVPIPNKSKISNDMILYIEIGW